MQNNNNQGSSLATLKAHTGCGQCVWLIGFFYAYGISVEKNLNLAIYWYELSTEKNNVFAQNSLAYYYQNGIGTEKDAKKAFELYEKAANQGHCKRLQNNVSNFKVRGRF